MFSLHNDYFSILLYNYFSMLLYNYFSMLLYNYFSMLLYIYFSMLYIYFSMLLYNYLSLLLYNYLCICFYLSQHNNSLHHFITYFIILSKFSLYFNGSIIFLFLPIFTSYPSSLLCHIKFTIITCINVCVCTSMYICNTRHDVNCVNELWYDHY